MFKELDNDLNFIFEKNNFFLSKIEFNFLLNKYKDKYIKNDIFKYIINYLLEKSKENITKNNSVKIFYKFVFDRYQLILFSEKDIYKEEDKLYFQLFRKAFLNDLILLTFNGELFLTELLFEFIKKVDLSIIDKNGLFIFHIIKHKKRNGYELIYMMKKEGIILPDLEKNSIFQEELFKIIYKIDIKDYLLLKDIFPWIEEKQKENFEKETNTNKYLISLNNLIKNL